jgi:hypothetical protein
MGILGGKSALGGGNQIAARILVDLWKKLVEWGWEYDRQHRLFRQDGPTVAVGGDLFSSAMSFFKP